MAPTRIALGDATRVTQLFSYPNTPGAAETLDATVLHWFNQTLMNDGTAAQGAKASVEVSATNDYTLVLDGPAPVAQALAMYAARVPKFLANGWDALTGVIPKIKADGKWDPSPDPPPPPYLPWRFFLPLGMAMVNQRSVQFFHYPPIRLLEQTRDYLDDPVPVRCFELLEANGVATGDVALYSSVVDATPIAAEDDQGSKSKDSNGKRVGDPNWGLIPIQYFGAYQKAQVELLLNAAQGNGAFTVPIVVYGAHPRQVFQQLYNVNLGASANGRFTPHATMVEIIPGRKTPVVGSNHPYVFYALAQGFVTVGSGHYLSAAACQGATAIMCGDLAIARWQKTMADDPSQDPQAVLDSCTAYWNGPARAAQVCALARHQASLFYSDPVSLAYSFKTSLAEGAAFCASNANSPCAGVTP